MYLNESSNNKLDTELDNNSVFLLECRFRR